MPKTSELKELFSDKRMQRYLSRSLDKPFDEYKNNIQQSMDMYKLISYFEVILRNKMDKVLTQKYGDWHLKNSDFIQKVLEPEQQSQLMYVINLPRVDSNDKDKIISELQLGFWTSLFNKKYDQSIWKDKSVYKVLGFVSMKGLSYQMNKIRKFRNRIFHQEIILTYQPDKMYDLIYKYLFEMIPEGYKTKKVLKEELKKPRYLSR